jgi:hypothetical protein
MTRLAELAAARSAREASRAVFDANLARVKADLEARGLGGRIADRVGESAAGALDETLDIIDSNRSVVAGTIAALRMWFLRSPIIAGAERLLGRGDPDQKEEDND